MSTDGKNLTFDAFCRIAEEFAPCMNDYLYVMDMVSDTYFITESATKRFRIPCNVFQDTMATFRTFVHPEDMQMLEADLTEILAGRKDEHNLEYRWLAADGSPVWINCRGRVIF